MSEPAHRDIVTATRRLLRRRRRLVLAVSGGVDSMVMLDAVARLRGPNHHVVVATVDHGTGDFATEACAVAAAVGASHRLRVITERLTPGRRSEAVWRARRWEFLNGIAKRESAAVVVAHTRDDQVETVVMRLLRGAGTRGLAGLYAPGDVERPLLGVTRSDVVRYAMHRSIRYIEDPSNLSVAFLRNRIRLNILPAIRAVHPEFDATMLRLSSEAAAWRREVDDAAGSMVIESAPGLLRVDPAVLETCDRNARHVLWPALAARAGVTLDRRGMERLAALVDAPVASRIQVSGGFEALRARTEIVIRPARAVSNAGPVQLAQGTVFGGFEFSVEPAPGGDERGDPWRIVLSRSAEPVVREWVAGDRIILDGNGTKRRVKRFFADRGIAGPLREGWPVVQVGADIVWVPGVVSSTAASPQSGERLEYRCRRIPV